MKCTLLLMISVLMIANVAMADHIGIYSDATGQSCNIGFPGQFNPNATVIHKFASGATGSSFGFTCPPGTAFFGFNSPYYICEFDCDHFSLGYGQCRTGSIVLGTINAIYGVGTVQVVHSDSFSDIIYADCSFELKVATGGSAYVGTTGDCTVAVEQSTWGSVKVLYR